MDAQNKLQKAAKFLLVIQIFALIVFIYIGRVHAEQMMSKAPWLKFDERIALYLTMIFALFVIIRNKIITGICLVLAIDVLIFINQTSINEGYFPNALFSFRDVVILAIARQMDLKSKGI